jgi:hypothetical protein
LEGEKEFACWVEMMGVSVGCGGKGLNEDSRALPPSRLSMTPQAFNTQRILGVASGPNWWKDGRALFFQSGHHEAATSEGCHAKIWLL